MRVARVQAQAKINLFLDVIGLLPGGYHEIQTEFHRIDLSDEVVVRVGGKERSLDASGPSMPPNGLGPMEKNLAYRAAIEYAARAGWEFPRGFAIELTKNIPVGGGLGGGSADAGAVLRALNALVPKPMARDELLKLGALLGADVAFLTTEDVMALAVGRGEFLVGVPQLLPPAHVLLAVPPFSISTADAYRWLDEARALEPKPEEGSIAGAELFRPGWEGLTHNSRNDFEPVVEKRYPLLREIRERLMAMGARMARLAGSGSCVFGLFDDFKPDPRDVGLDALVIPTNTSSRVVQVEVLE